MATRTVPPGLKNPIARFIIDRQALTIAIICCAASFIGLLFLFTTLKVVANDFSVYWRAANEPVYWAYLPHGYHPFPYPPTMLIWITPLNGLPLWPAFLGWGAISLAAFTYATRTHLRYSELLLCFFSPAMVHCIATGQVSALLTALLIYAFATPHRDRAGLALAIVASIKPQYVVMAPLYLLVTRDWRAVFWAAGGFVSLVLTSFLAYGTDLWFDWLGSMYDFHEVLMERNILVHSITMAGQATQAGYSALPFLIAGGLVGAWLVVTLRPRDAVTKTALVAGGSILVSPYALAYDLLPMVPFLAREIMRGARAGSVAIGIMSGPLPLILASFTLWRVARRPNSGIETVR